MDEQSTIDKEADESLSSAAGSGDAEQSNTTSTQGDKAGETSIFDAVKDGLKKQGATLTPDAEGEGDERSGSENELNAEEKALAESKKAELEKSGDKEKEDLVSNDEKGKEGEQEKEEPVPYKRFHEVVEQRTQAEEKLKVYEPQIQNYNNITRFCEENQITADQFDEALRVQALLNTNPEEALKKLLPLVEALQGYAGDKLPEDLQKKVDAGKIELDDAREIAQLRAKSQFSAKMSERNGKVAMERQQAELQQKMEVEASKWETTKRSSDPDYKPKAKESDPDGKWELVRDRYMAMINQRSVVDGRTVFVNPVNTPQEMVALLEKAYLSINGTFTNLRPKKPATRKSLSSNGSSSVNESGSIEEAPDMKTAIARGMKKMGYSVG